MNVITEAVLAGADSPWVYVVGFLAVTASALFPPVPSTSLFVALGALAATGPAPIPLLLVASMTAASMAGDYLLYALGRRFPPEQWPLLRGPRRQRALAAAEERLRVRPSELVITSRFIPLGRLTVNMVAGASRLPLRKFALTALLAGIVWSAYSVGMGFVSARWLPLPTLVTVLVAIALSLVLGKLLNVVLDWWDRHRGSRPAAADVAES